MACLYHALYPMGLSWIFSIWSEKSSWAKWLYETGIPSKNHLQESFGFCDSSVITQLSTSSAWGSTVSTPANDTNEWLGHSGAEGSCDLHEWANLFTALVIIGGGLVLSKLIFLLLQHPLLLYSEDLMFKTQRHSMIEFKGHWDAKQHGGWS